MLAEFNNRIMYHSGKQNSRDDVFTRRLADLPRGGNGHGRPTQAFITGVNFADLLKMKNANLMKTEIFVDLAKPEGFLLTLGML